MTLPIRAFRVPLTHARAARALLAAVLLAAPTRAALLPQTADYDEKDNVGGAWVNLATFPVRPMMHAPGGDLWVVNHHDSTVERFAGTSTTPDPVYGVPWAPVAIAWWDGKPSVGIGAEILVVCRGTWAVIGLDPATGAVKRVLQLRPGTTLHGGVDARIGRMAEPGDILVDEVNDRAFVSCSGADSVVQIDLAANQVVRVFNQEADPLTPGTPADTEYFRMKSPLFLSWDHDGEHVLVAPLHSGNNTLAEQGPFNSTKVVGYYGLFGVTRMPDEDLFRITPWVSAGVPGTVEPVLSRTGTILFAHGIHPDTDDFWQLNTEAINADPDLQTEPEVRGKFVQNRISIVQNAGTTWGGTVAPILSLDPDGLGGALTSMGSDPNVIGQPFALAFGTGGHAFITGLLTDNVLVLDQDGDYVMEWDLPAGAIPRGLLQHPSEDDQVLVYCWGDNAVRTYEVDTTAHTATLQLTQTLRHDPTPADVAAGRAMFFDAERSLEKNVSCASCHVEGGNDFLMWNLSNGPLELKGPMFTQTLVGLKRLAPFHWRGERSLADFGQLAFTGLLGANEVPSAEDFAEFEAFVFSLVNPANPNQNRTRVVDPTIHHPDATEGNPAHDTTIAGSGVLGQTKFKSPLFVNVARHACVDCHAFPTGTNNDINVEGEGETSARRAALKPTPFHEGWRKRQSLVEVSDLDVPGTTRFVPYLGSGFAHAGEFQDLFRFVSVVIDRESTIIRDDQKVNDITDFIHQWDQGLGLAVHFAYLLDAAAAGSGGSATTTAELDVYLHGEMTKGNCDIAVIGTAKPASGPLVCRRWAWDRVSGAYRCEDPAFADRSLGTFKTGATNDGESNVFLGLPLGMAERFAVDYDMDGVRNLDSIEVGHEYDETQPGWNNGLTPAFASGGSPVILWKTTKVARLVFTTNEPTTATIAYEDDLTGAVRTETSPLLARHHSVLLTGLRPSTAELDADSEDLGGAVPVPVPGYDAEDVAYHVAITLTDATGNAFAASEFSFETDTFIVPAELAADETPENFELKNQRTHVVQEISMDPITEGPISGIVKKTAKVKVTVAFKRGKLIESTPGAGDWHKRPAEDRVVFGRVLIERANGSVETLSQAGLTVTTNGSAKVADDVQIDFAGVLYSITSVPFGEDYVAGVVPTGSDGKTSLTFHLSPPANLDTDDRILFNVEGVLEVDTSASPFYVHTTSPSKIVYQILFRGAFNQWSFPDTTEAKATARSNALP